MRLKIIAIDLSKIVCVDWLNERKPCEGDEALVEDVSEMNDERVVRLLCEPRDGFLEWRLSVYESGLQFEMFPNA